MAHIAAQLTYWIDHMTIENITNPGVDPIDGDWITIHHPSGAIERKTYYAPVEPEPAPTTYKVLTKLQAIEVLMSIGGMTPAEMVTAREDPNLKFEWMVWEFAGTADVTRNSPNTAAVLAALMREEYITQTEVDAIMTNWPTE